MYLPFCGIAISNAQLFAASRKEYDRSRVSAKIEWTNIKLLSFAPVGSSYAYVFAKQTALFQKLYFQKIPVLIEAASRECGREIY